MSKLRKSALAASLLLVLCANGTALAASRDDSSPGNRPSDFFSRIARRIVHVLDDIRMSIPP